MAGEKIKNQIAKSKDTRPHRIRENVSGAAEQKLKNFASKITPIIFKFFLIFGVVLVSFSLFYSFFLPKNRFQQIKEKILKDPGNLNARLALVEVYLENNQFEEAEKELKKLQSYKATKLQDNQIEKLNDLWQKKREKDPKEIRKQAESWEKLLKQYPDYRDGYLQLAVLYAKLNETKKTQKAFEKALELAPNYEIAKDLQETLLNTD